MKFKEQFLNTPPGPARESLIYNAAVQQGPPKNLTPVTVNGPNGTKITYKVIPDYFMIEGIRVPMSPVTAQKVAAHFGMSLPTDKMSQQIYNAADTKVRAAPLSGTGYVGKDGKYYSGKDVANTRIGASDATIRYNELTDQEISKTNKTPKLIAGHGKDILEPISNSNDVSMGGWQGKDNKPLQPYSSPHKGEAANHTEYALFTRLVSPDVTVTMPDGRIINTTMEKLRNSPNLSQAISSSAKVKTYDTTTKPQTTTPKVNNPSGVTNQPDRLSFMQRIDQFLNQLSS